MFATQSRRARSRRSGCLNIERNVTIYAVYAPSAPQRRARCRLGHGRGASGPLVNVAPIPTPDNTHMPYETYALIHVVIIIVISDNLSKLVTFGTTLFYNACCHSLRLHHAITNVNIIFSNFAITLVDSMLDLLCIVANPLYSHALLIPQSSHWIAHDVYNGDLTLHCRLILLYYFYDV